MNKYFLLLLTCIVPGAFIQTQESRNKGFLEELMTQRAYKDDLHIRLLDHAEINITQSGNIAMFLALLTAARFAHISNELCHGDFSIYDDITMDNKTAAQWCGYLALSASALFLYRTLNAEKWLPVQRVAKEKVEDIAVTI